MPISLRDSPATALFLNPHLAIRLRRRRHIIHNACRAPTVLEGRQTSARLATNHRVSAHHERLETLRITLARDLPAKWRRHTVAPASRIARSTIPAERGLEQSEDSCRYWLCPRFVLFRPCFACVHSCSGAFRRTDIFARFTLKFFHPLPKAHLWTTKSTRQPTRTIRPS